MACDIWSLGVVLNEIITGEVPARRGDYRMPVCAHYFPYLALLSLLLILCWARRTHDSVEGAPEVVVPIASFGAHMAIEASLARWCSAAMRVMHSAVMICAGP